MTCSKLRDSLRDSMSFPMCTVGRRFQGMAVKDSPVRLGIPASDQNILDQFQHTVFIDSGLVHDKLTAKDLEKATSLKSFMETHCHESHYVFQVK